MRRLIPLILCLLLLCAAALADTPFFHCPTVVTAQAGGTAVIRYTKARSAPAGTVLLLDADGNELASASVGNGQSSGSLRLSMTDRFTNGQTLTLAFRHDGQTEIQGEILLALDDGTPGICQADTDEKVMAITFDSAIGEGRTLALLDLLDQYGVKCTFFLQGAFVQRHPDTARLIVQRGHEIASHSMNHPEMRDIDDEKILRDLRECNETVEQVTGQRVRFYRPPSGYYTYRDRAISRALGCEMILWTFDSLDGTFPDREGANAYTQLDIARAMQRGTQPGAIVLMHVYGRYTIQALEEYLPAMQAEGYRFVTVSELLGYDD